MTGQLGAMDEVFEALGAISNGLRRMIGLHGRIPKDVEFKICRRTVMGFLERANTVLHNFLGHGQCKLHVLGITAAGPKLRSDLEPGNFTIRANSGVVITGLKHGKCGPAVHRRSDMDSACSDQRNQRDSETIHIPTDSARGLPFKLRYYN